MEEYVGYEDANLRSTNNMWGWLHYFLAYLVVCCGMTKMGAVSYLSRAVTEAEDALRTGKSRNLSDNQCIMLTNRWFYHHRKNTSIVECQGIEGQISIASINWWIEYLRH